MKTRSELQAKLASLWPLLDERTRRLMAANEARALGRGRISEVSRACGLSRKAIAKGIQEIEAGTAPPPGRIRQPGAGRKKITEHDPRLAGALERLIDPDTRGDPETPLRWTCRSTRTLAAQLTRQRHPISHMKVAQLLHAQGYSLQGNRKTEEGDRRQLFLPLADNYFFRFVTSPAFGLVFGSFFFLSFKYVGLTGSPGRDNGPSSATAGAGSERRWAASVR